VGPLAVLFLRRVAIAALVLSVALVVGARLASSWGLVGPSAPECVAQARAGVEAARRYGADAGIPVLVEAARELAKAEAALQSGQAGDARRAARRAQALAIDAQKQALVRRARQRDLAQALVGTLDAGVNDLEDLYAHTTRGLEPRRVAVLLRGMKQTRQAAGLVFLAYEQHEYAQALAAGPPAQEALARMRKELESAGAGPLL
jgi:hypothetical protein